MGSKTVDELSGSDSEIIRIIKEVSGCDAKDEYARGWDDACREIERRIELYKSCGNCLFEYHCDWEPAGQRECCERWKKE